MKNKELKESDEFNLKAYGRVRLLIKLPIKANTHYKFNKLAGKVLCVLKTQNKPSNFLVYWEHELLNLLD